MVADKVSIIIVTFNAAKTIRQSIKSVLDQQYNNLELVVIDGASTDGTVDILRSFSHSTIQWVSEPDKGIYDAMNKGILLATGKWLLFLGADDTLCDGILHKIFSNDPYPSTALLYGTVINKDTRHIAGAASEYQQLIASNIPHQAIFYDRSTLNRLGRYDLRYKILADYDLNLRMFREKSIQKHFLDKSIAVFCATGISNRTIDYTFFSEKLAYFISHDGLAATDKRLAKYYFFTGVALVLKGSYRKGFTNLLHPVWYGERRLYYLILLGHFLLTLAGFGRKYTYV